MQSNIVQTNNLCKIYPNSDREAVSGLDLEIRKGEIYGLLGPNGAGKSTTLMMLCGLLKPSKGSIRYGAHFDHKDPLSFRANIGVVPQDIALYPQLTLKENLHFFGRMYGMKKQVLKQAVEELSEALDLQDFLNKQIRHCSGGMKKRGNLAVGILHKPSWLILDEPAAGVDFSHRQFILSVIHRLKENGTSILYTSHYLEEAERICDRIGIIHQGKLLEEDSPANLVKKYRVQDGLPGVFMSVTGQKIEQL